MSDSLPYLINSVLVVAKQVLPSEQTSFHALPFQGPAKFISSTLWFNTTVINISVSCILLIRLRCTYTGNTKIIKPISNHTGIIVLNSIQVLTIGQLFILWAPLRKHPEIPTVYDLMNLTQYQFVLMNQLEKHFLSYTFKQGGKNPQNRTVFLFREKNTEL